MPIQLIVQHAKQPVDLIGEAPDRIGLVALLIAQAPKMPTLAALGALIGHLPHQPLVDVVAPPHILGIEPAGLLGDVHHHRPGFKNADRLAPADGVMVNQGRHPVVGANLQKFVGELIATADIARNHVVGHAALFEQNGHLFAVRRGPIV